MKIVNRTDLVEPYIRKLSSQRESNFWSRVSVSESGCWLWGGQLDRDGYGRFQSRSLHEQRAHRFAWRITKGDIPHGMILCHSCDVRACVNPSHLFLGTANDNNQDMKAKGRQAKGEIQGNNKLKASQVLQIREAALSGENQYRIAERFGIAQTHVSEIKLRKSWAWL